MIAEKLKKSIIQAAIQGKLTDQLISDGDARSLLKEIQKEKIRLIKEGKIKEKQLSRITEDEIPFELPKSWEWVRLGSITKLITKGSSPKWQGVGYTEKESGILFITSKNVRSYILDLSNEKYVEKSFNSIEPRSILEKGDFLMNLVGASIGRTALFELDQKDANINQAVCLIRLCGNFINKKYLLYFFNSNLCINYMFDKQVETARPNLSMSNVAKFLIPVPPLCEQYRIVHQIDELLPLIENLEKQESKLDALEKKFPKKISDSILQYAIQGKLTEQLISDGDARDVLKKIQKEKEFLNQKRKIRIRKIKEKHYIKDLLFDIPNNWSWCRLNDVVFFQEGPGIRNWQFKNKGIKLLNVQNILPNNQLYFENSDKYVSEEEFKEKYTHFLVEEGDLLFAASGGSWGKSAWFKDPGYKVMMNTSTIRLRFFSQLFEPDYLKYFIDSKFFRKQMEVQLVGIQPNFGSTHLSRTYIPIPPISEQKRIVRCLEDLLPEIDKLNRLIQVSN